jgi:hypothetical protein
MINTIIFSKDRPAQLDLLLRTLSQSPLEHRLNILYSSSPEYQEGYKLVQEYHPTINMVEECDFRSDLLKLLDGQLGATQSKFTQFFCDDDIMYCRPDFTEANLEELFKLNVVAFSLRLGRNTWCQTPSTTERVQFPNFVKYAGALVWDYRTVGLNFSYFPSVDGTIFKTDLIKQASNQIAFKGPNQYEAHLSSISPPGFMACLDKSSVVGCCINRVQNEFQNAAGVLFAQDPKEMNEKFVGGLRLYCPQVQVVGAHQEIDLFWSK